MNKTHIPVVATHPGELLKDELKERKLSQKRLSEMTGVKASVISETISGKRAMSLSFAVALDKALDIPAEIWLNLQTQYDLDVVGIAKRDSQVETFPVTIPVEDKKLLKEIVRKFGWACVL